MLCMDVRNKRTKRKPEVCERVSKEVTAHCASDKDDVPLHWWDIAD